MRILLCDDQSIFMDKIQEYILRYHEKNKLHMPEIVKCVSGKLALNNLKGIDLAFIDIELGDMNGIEVAENLLQENRDAIIFIETAYQQYLDDAMRIRVFRYLSKPIDEERFYRNYKEALNSYANACSKLTVETKNGMEIIADRDIIMIESLRRKVYIHTETESYISLRSMNYWHDVLNDTFFYQPHKSFIINFRYIAGFDHNTIKFRGTEKRAFITRRKYKQFREAFLEYMVCSGGCK